LAELQYVHGLAEILDALEALPKNVANNINRGAANAMAMVVRDKARELAPVYEGNDPRVRPGQLKRNIIAVHSRSLSGTVRQTTVVTVRRGTGKYKKVVKNKVVYLDAYYWTWVEFGHWYVPPRPKAPEGGKRQSRAAWRKQHQGTQGAIWVEERPFIRPALTAAADDALKAGIAYYNRRIDEEVAKAAHFAAFMESRV
jgi:HK97 gp10 family phage protein